MPFVLIEGSELQCIHGGKVQLQASQSKLKIDGQAVILQSDLLKATISNCSNTNAQAGQTPCLKITSIVSGISTELVIDQQPAMLETATGLTNATPPAPLMWQVQSAGQTKLQSK